MNVLNKEAFKEWAKSHMVENPNYIEGFSDEDEKEFISFWDRNCLDSIYEGHLDTMVHIFNTLNKNK